MTVQKNRKKIKKVEKILYVYTEIVVQLPVKKIFCNVYQFFIIDKKKLEEQCCKLFVLFVRLFPFPLYLLLLE